MARRRKSGPKRKKEPRTKSGRLSRAYKSNPECVDRGTREFREKRLAIVNGADPQLSASASGNLLANGALTPKQHSAAQRYAWAHSLRWGRPWRQICPLGDRVGSEPPARMQEIARDKLGKMDRCMTKGERQHFANVAVFGFLPQWFYAASGIGRALPEDERERQELLSGLDAISGDETPR